MPNTDGRKPLEHSDAQAEAIATRAAKAALYEVLTFLGYDFTKGSEVARWHANQQWVEEHRIREEKLVVDRRKQVWGAVITGAVLALFSGATGFGRFIIDHIMGVRL